MDYFLWIDLIQSAKWDEVFDITNADCSALNTLKLDKHDEISICKFSVDTSFVDLVLQKQDSFVRKISIQKPMMQKRILARLALPNLSVHNFNNLIYINILQNEANQII